jgi:hypothetical protein
MHFIQCVAEIRLELRIKAKGVITCGQHLSFDDPMGMC